MNDNEDLSNSYSELMSKARSLNYEEYPEKFVLDATNALIKDASVENFNGHAMAALFDLAVTAVYLEKVASSGWYYCADHAEPYLVYPFVNACPICTLAGEPKHVKAKKPQSAQIGMATSIVLASFLDLKAKSVKGENYEVRFINDNGMVDAYLKGPGTITLFEIKSAPLIAYPLIVSVEKLTELNDDLGEVTDKESHTDANVSQGQEAFLIVGESLRIPVGDVFKFGDQSHYARIVTWLSSGENLKEYVNAWSHIFSGYAEQGARTASYWMTNGCGMPSPRPVGWPRRKGQGFESISDGKSSVGMDRTDDLKKGIYQVLKISTHYKEFFPNENLDVTVALVSNIHAVKHGEGYLGELEDIVWTLDGKERSYISINSLGEKVVKEGKLYNLFDAIISFTDSHFRSEFLKEIFSNEK